jgi:hypothetical protein
MNEFKLINNEIIYKDEFNLGNIEMYNIVWGELFYDGKAVDEMKEEFKRELISFVNKIKGHTVCIGYKGIRPEDIKCIEDSKFLFENGKYIPFTKYSLDVVARDTFRHDRIKCEK